MNNEIFTVPEPDQSGFVKKRQSQEKAMLLEELKKIPIIEMACRKTNVGRTTFYRWRKKDKKFAKKVDEAIIEGDSAISDMAESKLIAAINDRELGAVTFWLKHRDARYSSKLEVISGQKPADDVLSVKQSDLASKVLQFINMENIVNDDTNTQIDSNKPDGNDQSVKPVGQGLESPEVSGQK